MKMKNVTNHPITITSDVVEKWDGSGPRPAKITIPPGAVVHVVNSYAVKQRTLFGEQRQEIPSTIDRLCGAPRMLVPFGAEAEETAKMFADELPEVIREQVRDAMRNNSIGVSVREDPRVKQQAEALAFGEKMLAVMGERAQRERPTAAPAFEEEPAKP